MTYDENSRLGGRICQCPRVGGACQRLTVPVLGGFRRSIRGAELRYVQEEVDVGNALDVMQLEFRPEYNDGPSWGVWEDGRPGIARVTRLAS